MNKLDDKILDLIIKLRRKINPETNWREFDNLVKNNIKTICKRINTRFLISICDTYVDYGNPIESRNAMIISAITNMEKLSQTYFAMFDTSLNKKKIKYLKSNKIELWDGMTSFNLSKGDLTQNMFRRIDQCLQETPELHAIFVTLLKRIKKNNNKTILGGLNKYHNKIFKF